MTPPSRLERLRALVHEPPSEWAWGALCALFRDWPSSDDLSVGLEYADQHLVCWPDTLRSHPTLPNPDRLPPHWPLVRCVGRQGAYNSAFLQGRRATNANTARFVMHPCARHITRLTLPITSTPDTVQTVSDAASLPNLHTLDIGNTTLESYPNDALRALKRSPLAARLRGLGLARLIRDQAALESLLDGDAFPHLEALDLSYGRQGASALEALHRANIGRRLARLRLRSLIHPASYRRPQTPLERILHTLRSAPSPNAPLGLLAPLSDPAVLPRLEQLNVSNTTLDPDTIEALCTPQRANLRVLVLSKCGLNHDAIAHLSAWPHLGQLNTLCLQRNGHRGSQDSAERIVAQPAWGTIARLDLGPETFHNAAIERLLETPHLTFYTRVSLVATIAHNAFGALRHRRGVRTKRLERDEANWRVAATYPTAAPQPPPHPFVRSGPPYQRSVPL